MAEKQGGKGRAERKRRVRDPSATRETILEAAQTLLSKRGMDGISLSEVAHLAGVNRGTAYQHFETREKLIEATLHDVSDKMFRAVFGDPETIGERRVEEVDIVEMNKRLTRFAMENPELSRIWLLQLLALPDPTSDPFWREFEGSLSRYGDTDLARDNIDSEPLSVMLLAGAFLWPVWARSHAKTDEERRDLIDRFCHEVLRFSLYGSSIPELNPEVVQFVEQVRRKRADSN